VFSAKESTTERCPVCFKNDLNYSRAEIIDEGIVHPWVCQSCGAEGNEYDKTVFDGHEVILVPNGYTIPVIKMIAVIGDGYIRDAQVYTADPDYIDENSEFADLKCPCQYVGIFEGGDPDDVKRKAAVHAGVHPGVITLIDISLSSSQVYEDGEGLTRCSMCTAVIVCDEGGDMPTVCPECTRKLDYSAYKPKTTANPARSCKCGNNRFYAHQVNHHDIVTSGNGHYIEDRGVYYSKAPFGPFTCTECSASYEELPDGES
jgi:ribosomal protein L37AE/L43A